MFSGTYYHTLDEKGRIAIPRKFRELLGGQSEIRVVVTRWVGRLPKTVDVFPRPEWDRLLERVGDMPEFDDDTVEFRRRYVHPAHELVLDAQGRILIPPKLREQIGLTKEAVFTGDGRKFMVWDRDHWEHQQEADEKSGAGKLGGLKL